MNIVKSPKNVLSFKFNRSLGAYGGFEGIGGQWYNVLCMVEELIGHLLDKNEIIKIYITTEINSNWVKFTPDEDQLRRNFYDDYKFNYTKGWIHLKNDFVEEYKLQNGFYLKNRSY